VLYENPYIVRRGRDSPYLGSQDIMQNDTVRLLFR